jgi:hypothetical protein
MTTLPLAENFYFNHPDNRRGKRTGLFGLDPSSRVYSKRKFSNQLAYDVQLITSL